MKRLWLTHGGFESAIQILQEHDVLVAQGGAIEKERPGWFSEMD
jgi:hypothetical protein